MFTIDAAARVDHVPAEHLAGDPEPVEVDAHDLAPLVVGHLEGGLVDAGAGVVHEHVDPAEALDALGEQPLDVGADRHVGEHHERLDAEPGQLRLDRGGSLGVPADDRRCSRPPPRAPGRTIGRGRAWTR